MDKGHACRKAGRKCSVEKQFDLVDIENMAFNNLFVDPNAPQQEGQKLAATTQPNLSIAKVSRYPRTTMPSELKDRFEIDIKAASNQNRNDQYDDEFWRRESYLKSAKQSNGMPPFFQQFRPETCYKFS